MVSFGQKLKDLEQVLPLGNNTFEYTREAGTGFTRQTKLLKKAMAVVEAFADGKGKEYEVVEVFRNEGPFVLGNYPKVKITFKLPLMEVNQVLKNLLNPLRFLIIRKQI